MSATTISAQLCVAYTDSSMGAATTWRFADRATGYDYAVALFFAASWAAHNRRRERATACKYEFLWSTN